MNKNEQCVSCGEDTAIRNPTGKCDHLYYPENINKNEQAEWEDEFKDFECKGYSCHCETLEKHWIVFDCDINNLLKKQEARIRSEERNLAVKTLMLTPKLDHYCRCESKYLVSLEVDKYEELKTQILNN